MVAFRVRPRSLPRLALAAALVAGATFGCSLLVSFRDCTQDGDCRAGERCNPQRRYCEVPAVELCNGVDDDRDGVADEAESFGVCEVPRRGAGCRDGVRRCRAGNRLECVQRTSTRSEVCNNGIDDDCNGVVDDGAGCMLNYAGTTGLVVGSNDPGYGEGDDAPEHRVCLGPFAMDRFEVTFRAYASWLSTLDRTRLRFDRPPRPLNPTEPYGRYVLYDDNGTVDALLLLPDPADGLTIDRRGEEFVPHDPAAANLPVVNVTWFGADRYCRWAGKHLPSEAEWWRAVKGPNVSAPRPFPWGPEPPTCDRANIGVGGRADGGACVGRPVAVGSLPLGREPEGVFELYGNANEWMFDYLDDNITHTFNNYYHLFDDAGAAITSLDPGVNPWCRAFPLGPLGPDAGSPIARPNTDGGLYCLRCRMAHGRHYQTVDPRIGIRRWRDADQTDATLGFRCASGGAPR